VLSLPHRFANKEVILDLTIDHSIPTEPPLRSIYLCLSFLRTYPSNQKEKKKEKFLVCDLIGPKGVYSTHSPVSRTARRVRLRMRTSFPFALPTLRSHGYQSGGRVGSRYHEPSVPHIYQEASVVHRFHRMLLSLGKDRVSVQLCFGCFAME